MTVYFCPECNLVDPYNGGGDGIGSCDCERMECCGEVSVFCDCPEFDDEEREGEW